MNNHRIRCHWKNILSLLSLLALMGCGEQNLNSSEQAFLMKDANGKEVWLEGMRSADEEYPTISRKARDDQELREMIQAAEKIVSCGCKTNVINNCHIEFDKPIGVPDDVEGPACLGTCVLAYHYIIGPHGARVAVIDNSEPCGWQ